MNCLDGVLESLDITNFASIETRLKPIEELWQGIDNVVNNAKHAVEIYKRTGVAPELKFETWETSLVFEDELQRLSLKENVRPDENASMENTRRPRRNTTRQAAQSHIKKEKLSLLKLASAEMPAPTKSARKRTKQRQQASQLCIKEETSESRDSVIIQDAEIPVVDLLDSDDNESNEEMPNAIRLSSRNTRQKISENIAIKKEKASKIMPQGTTATVVNLPESDNEQEAVNKTEVEPMLQNKVKVKKEKIRAEPLNVAQDMTMVVVNLVDSIGAEEKTTRSTSKTRNKEIKKRARIDSLSDSDEQNSEKKSKSDSDNLEDLPLDPINDATFVSKPCTNVTPNAMNATMVVKNPKFSNNNKLVENEGAIAKTVTKVPRPNNTKLEATGAKKKIQSSLESAKTSRTNARGQAKEQGMAAVAAKPEVCTPGIPKLISKLATSTAKKATHTPQSSSSSRLIASKYASELKGSQAEYREREKRREKEKGALVSLQVQLEERQRMFEEKRARLQQKHLQELAKKKVLKMKVLEEPKRQEKPKGKEENKRPIYMTMEPPFLPTEDCYDTDDEERPKRTLKQPLWAKSGYLKETMFCLLAAGETIKNTFFSRQVETPDLLEIFEIIQPEKLKRSSSAIWHKAPRYTMMPVLDQHLENSDEDED